MAASAWRIFHAAKAWKGNGTINLTSHQFAVALLVGTYTPNLAHEVWADVSSHEVAAGNGYTAGGLNVTHTWAQASGIAVFDSNDPEWVASGAGITARYAVLYDKTPTSPLKPLVAYCALDSANIVKASGELLRINLSASGYFSESGGT